MIRPATAQDRDRIEEMARAFVADSEYRDVLTIDHAAMMHTFDGLIDNPDAAILVSWAGDSSPDGFTLTGMIALVAYRHPFSGELTGSEMVWWVEPEARGHGVRLLRAAEDWARERGCKRLQMVAPNDRVGAMYDRLGYSKLETTFERGL